MGRPILGVIGGMGPLATVAFLRTLALHTEARRDQDHLHVLIESDPSIPDRTEFIVGSGPDPRPAIIGVARRLEAAGATLLVMPCNTAHLFAEDIVAAVGVPLIPWIELAAGAVSQGSRHVGLLATTGTITSRVYQQAIERTGRSVIVPTAEGQEVVMDAIYGPRGVKATGSIPQAARRQLLGVADDLARRGADQLILACTELPLAISAGDPDWPIPAVDPAVEVAREAIRLAGSTAR